MARGREFLFWITALALPLSVARAQDAQTVIQQVVDSERAANQNDHSQWVYLEESRKPKEHIVQWVASTPRGDVRRILEKDGERFPDEKQRDSIQRFLHDTHAQNKQVTENAHDNQQIDDFLKLLPAAFIWSVTKANPTNTFLHFEPNPKFHPPTREARVFSAMAGDVVVDNQQHRVRSMSGHLMHEVTFGGGLLGRLKEGSSFALEQDQVGPAVWQLTAVHVHLEGNAFLFKSVSLQEDDTRSKFTAQPPAVTLDQAATVVMREPEVARLTNDPSSR